MVVKILYILLAIAILLLLIMVHELGHYIAGKILKFKIKEFSIGFGKAIFQKKMKSGEVFSLRIFPLGGFCAFEGEDEDAKTDGAFNSQKPWKRLIVLFSGVFFNFIFGVLTAVLYLSVCAYGVPKISNYTNANINGFQKGDIVRYVDGKEIQIYRTFDDMVSKFDENEEFIVTVERDGSLVDLTVRRYNIPACRVIGNFDALADKIYTKSGETYTLLQGEELKSYIENINNPIDSLYKFDDSTYSVYTKDEILSLGEIVEKPEGVSLGVIYTQIAERYNFGEALLYAFPFCISICGLILQVLGGLFTGATPISEVGGTITAVSEIAKISSISLKYLLYIIPMLSMNLALFNILPIPALDGARMVFVFIEWIRKKPINRNVEGYIHFFGLIILFALVIVLDVYHLFFIK